MFNTYQWENYLKSGGNKVIKIFEDIHELKGTNEFCETMYKFHKCYCPETYTNMEVKKEISRFFTDLKKERIFPFFEENVEYDSKSGCIAIWDLLKTELSLNQDIEVLDIIIGNQIYLTTQIAFERPDIFIPYYFEGNFNIITYIVKMFNINLDVDNLPLKKDYKERFMYYGDICRAFHEFRYDNKLSIAELWAFLYDYAPKCVGGLQYIKSEIPRPRSAFLIGGTKDDEFIRGNSNNNITLWQCNPDTRIGDAIIMYLRTPLSRLDAVWRSVSAGFNDPFFWYYRCTYIGLPKKLKGYNNFNLDKMKKDKVLGKLPIVRKNMQGINGVELAPSVYNYIIKENDDIINIEFNNDINDTTIFSEHDVEIKLLEPLLKNLGWKKADYITQFSVKMGRKEKIIPDYVIMPTYTPYHETAHFVWEVKKTIPNLRQLEKDKGQAVSYARRLNAKGCALVSQEGIWIMLKDDDYSNVIFQQTWSEINNKDIFKNLLDIAGK